jgi:hypothetical protein
MSNVVWSSWGGPVATGAGTLTENDCTPDCAQGTDQSEAATISLTEGTGYRYEAVTVTPEPPNTY